MLIDAFLRRRTAIPDHVLVEIAGEALRVDVVVNARARRYSLRLPAAGGAPVLTVPAGGVFSTAKAFLDRHRGWLEAKLQRRPERIGFVHGAIVPLRGEPHRIFHRPDLRGTAWLDTIGETPHLCVAGRAEHVGRRVADFLKREAKRDLEPAVARHAARLGVRASAIRLKDTKSRWGSCTASGDLSFSWRIVLAPAHVLDYLAAHEVAHLREMNHSARFWRLVAETCPDMERGQAWLKRHGASLHSYGP